MRTTTKNFASFAMILVLAIVLVTTMGFSISTGISVAADNGTITYLDEISVGHMSDIHYFPLEHCYQDVYGPTYKDSEFYHSTTGDTKLVLESGLVLNAAVQQILKDGQNKTAPQYLIASGDLSKNGERVALIDVANTLRYLQNEMRKLEGYENFQVFATVGNHDLYNHNGALYSQEDGSARPADMVTAMQFTMIFAGLGFPEVSLNTDVDGQLTLTDYFPEEYWSSDYTDGYVPSTNAKNLKISYYSEAITEALTKTNSSDILNCYFNIGDELNKLTYFVSLTDKTDYSFAIIDSTDREATETGALVRISKEEYQSLEIKPLLYIDDGTGNVNIDFSTTVPFDSAFSQDENAVYRRTPVQHITGGRITTECLNWVEEMSKAQNVEHASSADKLEETIIGVAHHNILPHFEQEDDILKDFTLYNWEYTANRFLNMGIRYILTGHMHASDAMSYTDVEGRTFYDFETGSTISYASPRRYLTFTRNNCDGKLGEQLLSEVHILGDITKVASNHITSAKAWDDDKYQTEIEKYKAIDENDVQARAAAWKNVVASNPDYLTYIIRYDEFASLTDGFTNTSSLYNDFISKDIYGILVDRMVDHFINQSTIDGLLESVHSLLLGLDEQEGMVKTILGMLDVDGVTLDIAASYMIDTILNNLYGDKGYVYDGTKYDNALDYVLAVVNHILDLEYGDENVGMDESKNPNKKNGNVGKLKVREIASFIMMAHSAGNEISLDETYESIEQMFGDNDQDYGANIYRYKQPTNPIYRQRMLAAIKDFDAQLKSGDVVQVLLDSILDPLFNDENSLLKTLLDYKFDFSKADWDNDKVDYDDDDNPYFTQYKSLENLFANKLNSLVQSPFIKQLISAFITLPDDISLSYDASSVSLNEILSDILPVVKPLIGDMLGFNMIGDSLVEIVDNLLGDYITPSFLVGLGGIASDIVIAFATDVYPDTSDLTNPAEPYAIQPYGDYTYAGEKMSYVSSKNVVSTVGAEFNAANQANGRVPGRVTANFDTVNSTTAFTVKFYTAEDVYGTFKYKTSENGEWISLSTSKAIAEAAYAQKKTDYFDSKAENTTDGIKVTMLTQTKPVYVPLIDLGLLCLTHTQIEDKETEVAYTYEDRDKAAKNSVVYWNVTTVTVTGLSPDTTYYYDIEGCYENNGVTANFSFVEYNKILGYEKDYFTFTTAKDSSADKFEFLTIADIQGMIQGMYDDSFKAVEALLANDATKNFDFILNAGDMCDNGKNFNQWAYALNTYQTLFANSSMFFASGNHENGSNAMTNYFNYTLRNTKQDTVDGVYYSFDYGNAHFAVLNTNDADENGLGATQLQWLTNDLTASQAKWKFVLMHKSIYSVGSHSTDSEVVAMRTQLQKLFAETGVNIVFGGHDHTYTTTYLVDKDGNAVDKSDNAEIQYTGDGGVLYITLGTMGTKFYNYKQNDDIFGNFDEDRSIFETLTSQTFGKVVVDGDTITYTGYQYDSANNSIKVIGENKLTPAPSQNSNGGGDNGNGGLSTGGKIAIGVVIPVVVLAAAAVVVVIVLKKQKEKKRLEELRRKKIAALKRAKALAAAKAAAEQAEAENDSDSKQEEEQTTPEQN